MHRVLISIESRKSDVIYNSIKQEAAPRANVNVSKKGDVVEIEILSENASNLRAPGAPYDIRLHFENYTSREPQPYRYEGGAWWQALRLGNGKLVPVEVVSGGIADEPLLKVNVFSDTSKEENNGVLNQIKRIFNTDYDLKPLYEFMEKDPILGRIKNDHYGLIPSPECI